MNSLMQVAGLIACIAYVGVSVDVCAQARTIGATGYPNKPIRLLVPFPPGSATDIQARIIGQKLAQDLGEQVVVDNRGGANGIIGTDLVAKAAPDGYTLLFVPNSHSINPSLYQKLPYDAAKDFIAVTDVAWAPLILVVQPSVPARSLAELIALAKTKPGQLNYASSGAGNITHFAGELLKLMAGINVVHVPYTGGPAALNALLGGEVELSFMGLPPALPSVQAGKLRALASTGAARAAAVPDLPTVSEAGVKGYEAISWWGVLLPVGVPAAIVDKLYAQIMNILRMPDVHERFLGMGLEPRTRTPREFAEYIRSEIANWSKIVKETGIRLE